MADGLPDAAAAVGGNDDGKRSGGQFELRNSPNLSEVESSFVILRVVPGIKNSRYQQEFLMLLFFRYWRLDLRFLRR